MVAIISTWYGLLAITLAVIIIRIIKPLFLSSEGLSF